MMTLRFRDIFGVAKPMIGVLHLPPLPGSPDFGGDVPAIKERAVREARVLADTGYDGLIVENFGDLPFLKYSVGPETVAAMAVVAEAVKGAVDLPVGVNVLRNDYASALGVAAACGCEFIRVNVLVGAYVTPEGLIEGRPAEVLRLRQRVAPDKLIFADVCVKHARPIAGTTIDDEAVDAVERGRADCVIVTGARTGGAVAAEDVRAVRTRLDLEGLRVPVLVGSGVTASNAPEMFGLCDGIIVGSYIRRMGRAGGEIEPAKAAELAEIRQQVEG
jgi:membrane complex biogenesis BtpA family protein